MKGRGKGVAPQSARSRLPAGGVPAFVFTHLSRTPIVDFAHYQDHDILPIFIDRYRVIRDCQKLKGPRRSLAGILRRVGSRLPWAEWQMGTIYPRHGTRPFGLQSDGTRPDIELYRRRERERQRRAAASVVSGGTLSCGHHRSAS
jgi:hypothetical protein